MWVPICAELRNLGKIAWVAIRDLERVGPFERSITGPSDHAVAKRHEISIQPLYGTHDATVTTFLTPPAWS